MIQVAAEMMTRGFGPGGPGARSGTAMTVIVASTGVSPIATAFNRDGSDITLILAPARRHPEGLQALEHRGLARAEKLERSRAASAGYVVSRLGSDALQNDSVEGVLVEAPPSPNELTARAEPGCAPGRRVAPQAGGITLPAIRRRSSQHTSVKPGRPLSQERSLASVPVTAP